MGVSRNTESATRDIEPPTAYARPLEKSMMRRCSSLGLPCRLRMTAWLPLTRSPISWASLKLRGSTTWTFAALVGTLRTTGGRGTDTPDGGSSRGRARTVGSP